ncbi:mitochondrial import inner membrane translocase subunit Tim21 [Rhinatrema bivittatum]|uniref:mitochondrial import inner membrane translocase subunit Tim21 n=1 Tax=Rhinatrema bivittatum TaxID=194408 RepID=UPI00112ECEAB|nr:mitochondrial import inner membrane translocase subunit Tim21 [Rhinatrema bivittatum]
MTGYLQPARTCTCGSSPSRRCPRPVVPLETEELDARTAPARELGKGRIQASCARLRPRTCEHFTIRQFKAQQRAGRGAPSVKQQPLQKLQTDPPSQTTAQKVKEAGRDFTYLIVVLVGIGVTGGLFYVVFKELFSSSSPSKIFGVALEKCRSHPEVIGAFGEPIKGYGEITRRGRRQHVSHFEYVKDGLKYIRLKFYIEGSEPNKQGTVHLEVKENPESGKYEFCYIFVEIDTYPRRTIVIEDNRY